MSIRGHLGELIKQPDLFLFQKLTFFFLIDQAKLAKTILPEIDTISLWKTEIVSPFHWDEGFPGNIHVGHHFVFPK